MITTIHSFYTDKRLIAQQLNDLGYICATKLYSKHNDFNILKHLTKKIKAKELKKLVDGESQFIRCDRDTSKISELEQTITPFFIVRCVCVDYGSSGKSYWYKIQDLYNVLLNTNI